MFETFFRVKERCPRCNFPIQREEGHWLGAIGINMIVTFTLLFFTMLVSFLLTIEERRAVRVLIPCLIVACLTPVLFFGSSHTLWSAIDLGDAPPRTQRRHRPPLDPPAQSNASGDAAQPPGGASDGAARRRSVQRGLRGRGTPMRQCAWSL